MYLYIWSNISSTWSKSIKLESDIVYLGFADESKKDILCITENSLQTLKIDIENSLFEEDATKKITGTVLNVKECSETWGQCKLLLLILHEKKLSLFACGSNKKLYKLLEEK